VSSTVGDELRLATTDRSKVIGISVKDRSAILPAGRHANAAYWFSVAVGNMVSSTYYFKELPAWVTAFNNTKPADKYFGAKWERLLPENEYIRRAGPDNPPWENARVFFRTRSPAGGRRPEELSTLSSITRLFQTSCSSRSRNRQ
jgi:hypothetical protein